MSAYGLTPSMTLSMESNVRVVPALVERKRRMRVQHAAIRVVVGTLQGCEQQGLVIETRKLID